MSTLEYAIRDLVTESPDNQYQTINGIAYFTKGECTNGSLGCMIGQGLHRIGYEIPEDADDNWSLGELIGAADPGAGDDESWFYHLQAAQDNGARWQDALNEADEKYESELGI